MQYYILRNAKKYFKTIKLLLKKIEMFHLTPSVRVVSDMILIVLFFTTKAQYNNTPINTNNNCSAFSQEVMFFYYTQQPNILPTE